MIGIWIDAKHRIIEQFKLDRTVATLEPLQMMVGGYIERVGYLAEGVECFADEEGRVKNLTYGFSFGAGPLIYGSAVVLSGDDTTGDWVDLPHVEQWLAKLREVVRWHELDNVASMPPQWRWIES